MADPRNELADIIVPAAPVMAAPAGNSPWLWVAAGMALMACIALLAWWWHRRRPVRALRAIAEAAAMRQGTSAALAGRLDAWARLHFRLARLDAARCPTGLDPAAWSDWATTLEQLRFASPQSDDFALLLRLCERARVWRRRA